MYSKENKEKSMKKKILIAVSAVIIIAIALFLFLNIRGNVKVEKGTIRITKLDEANFGNVDNLKETYESLQNDSLAQKIRKNDIFKSDSIDDYILVGVSLDIKNNSIFNASEISGYLVLDDADSPIIYKEGSIEVEKVKGYEKDNVFLMSLILYKGDMTDDEIIEYIKNLDIEINYRNRVLTHINKNIKLSDYDMDVIFTDSEE